MTTLRATLRPDVSAVSPPGCRHLAADVVVPARLPERPTVLVCFPGGGMSRRYFDLPLAGYSFAEFAVARGAVVVLLDHPAVGDSDRPDDLWQLTPRVVATADAAAVAAVVGLLRSGGVAGVPGFEPAVVLGVGHSAGAMLLLHQQAVGREAGRRVYDGLALLGWGTGGMPAYLGDAARALIGTDVTDDQLIAAARAQFGEPVKGPGPGSSQLLVPGGMDADVRAALRTAGSPLLTVLGTAAMIPGSADPAAARVDVPVFVGVGERDIATGHDTVAEVFPAAPSVTVHLLPGAGHNHNIEPNRDQLWSALLDWAAPIVHRKD